MINRQVFCHVRSTVTYDTQLNLLQRTIWSPLARLCPAGQANFICINWVQNAPGGQFITTSVDTPRAWLRWLMVCLFIFYHSDFSRLLLPKYHHIEIMITHELHFQISTFYRIVVCSALVADYTRPRRRYWCINSLTSARCFSKVT